MYIILHTEKSVYKYLGHKFDWNQWGANIYTHPLVYVRAHTALSKMALFRWALEPLRLSLRNPVRELPTPGAEKQTERITVSGSEFKRLLLIYFLNLISE